MCKGGAAFSGGSQLTFINCAITGNETSVDALGLVATSFGGGIFAAGGVQLLNSTLAGNSCFGTGNIVAVYGGGAYVTSGTTTLRNSTVAANTCTTPATNFAAWGGGIYVKATGTADLGNTIVAANSVQAGGLGPDTHGVMTSQGHNLIGDSANGSGFTGTDITSVSALSVFRDVDASGVIDAGDIAANGGLTRTMALLASGPAYNAGDNALIPVDPDTALPVTTDQRGVGYSRYPRWHGGHRRPRDPGGGHTRTACLRGLCGR